MATPLEMTLRWCLAAQHAVRQYERVPHISNIVCSVRDLALGRDSAVGVCVVNTVTWLSVGVIVGSVRQNTLDTLAPRIVAQLEPHHQRHTLQNIVCLTVYEKQCTLHKQAVTVEVPSHGTWRVHFVLFSADNMLNNPFNMNITPNDYRIVSPDSDEHAAILRYTSQTQLAKMLDNDAVARVLGLRAGDLVAHTRCLGTLPPTTMYRYVTTHA